MDINYAQAAVFTPSDYQFSRDGIAAEADSNEETILVCDLDLDDLQEARNLGTVRPLSDRRVDLFEYIPKFDSARATTIPPAPPLGDQPSGED